jgi:hypothetical protein
LLFACFAGILPIGKMASRELFSGEICLAS